MALWQFLPLRFPLGILCLVLMFHFFKVPYFILYQNINENDCPDTFDFKIEFRKSYVNKYGFTSHAKMAAILVTVVFLFEMF